MPFSYSHSPPRPPPDTAKKLSAISPQPSTLQPGSGIHTPWPAFRPATRHGEQSGHGTTHTAGSATAWATSITGHVCPRRGKATPGPDRTRPGSSSQHIHHVQKHRRRKARTKRPWPDPPSKGDLIRNHAQGGAMRGAVITLNSTHHPPEAVVELNGIEPMTSCLQSTRSPN